MKRNVLSGLLALAVLVGCANGTIGTEGLSTAREILSSAKLGKDDTPPPQITGQQISAELAASAAPLLLVVTESTQGQSLVRQIERNGREATFANASREALIIRDGIIVGSRGLGGDLMSAQLKSLERLVRTRQAGASQIELVFLDAADQPQRQVYTCQVSVGGTAPVALGVINTTARAVSAQCQGADAFTNSYLVATDGYVLGARQWLGPTIGYLSTQALRR